jgi:hypothetical protein
MPQFDFYSFSVQVFWTLSGFFLFYFIFLGDLLVKLSALLKLRSKLLVGSTINDGVLKLYTSCFLTNTNL